MWEEIQKILDAILPVVGYAAFAYLATRFTLAIAQAIVRTTKTLDHEAKMAVIREEAAATALEERTEQIKAQQEALAASAKLIDESSAENVEDAAGQNPQEAPAG